MRRVAWTVVVGLGLLLGCGDDEEGEVGNCSWYPDSCSEGLQCFPELEKPGKTVCLEDGPRARGEPCGFAPETPETWCGRELLCVGYGPDGDDYRCAPMCETDDDCAAWQGATRCVTGAESGIKFCALQ